MASPYYEEGTYLCRVVGQALGKSKQKSTPFFALRFKVLEGINPAGKVNAQYERTAYLYITEGTVEYLMPKLQSIGFNRDSFRYLDPSEPNHHSFVGQEVEMYCKHEDDQNNEPREKWDIARTGGGELEVDALDAAAKRQLDNMFGRHLKGNGSRTQAQVAPKRQQPAGAIDSGVTDDDVPF